MKPFICMIIPLIITAALVVPSVLYNNSRTQGIKNDLQELDICIMYYLNGLDELKKAVSEDKNIENRDSLLTSIGETYKGIKETQIKLRSDRVGDRTYLTECLMNILGYAKDVEILYAKVGIEFEEYEFTMEVN